MRFVDFSKIKAVEQFLIERIIYRKEYMGLYTKIKLTENYIYSRAGTAPSDLVDLTVDLTALKHPKRAVYLP